MELQGVPRKTMRTLWLNSLPSWVGSSNWHQVSYQRYHCGLIIGNCAGLMGMITHSKETYQPTSIKTRDRGIFMAQVTQPYSKTLAADWTSHEFASSFRHEARYGHDRWGKPNKVLLIMSCTHIYIYLLYIYIYICLNIYIYTQSTTIYLHIVKNDVCISV